MSHRDRVSSIPEAKPEKQVPYSHSYEDPVVMDPCSVWSTQLVLERIEAEGVNSPEMTRKLHAVCPTHAFVM